MFAFINGALLRVDYFCLIHILNSFNASINQVFRWIYSFDYFDYSKFIVLTFLLHQLFENNR